MARPREKLPPGARDLLTRMAPNGMRESVAANALGMLLKDFRRVIKENDYARELWEDCKAIERDRLLDSLYSRAIEGDSKAAQFLLAARHGLSEKRPQSATQGVQITFQLPDSMKPEQYLEAIRPQPQAIMEQSQ